MELKNKKIIEKIINILLNILIFLFGIVLLISIYTGIQNKVLGNSYADFFGFSIFEVQTGSMKDAIDVGDCIIVKLTKDVKLNDIITYKLGKEYITHRVIEVYSGTYVTKGDANNAKDKSIDQNQIVGKVVKILPNFGIIRKTLYNPSVLIALIITLFMFNFALKKGTSKKETNKKQYPQLKNIYIKIEKYVLNILLNIKKYIKRKKSIKEVCGSNYMNYDDYKKIFESNKTKTDDTVKEDLEKTDIFRVISVNAEEVNDKYKEIKKEEEDFDATSVYRVISVDADEVNDTLLEIADNEIKETTSKKQSNKEALVYDDKIDEDPDDDSLVKMNLELIKKKHKKSNNIIDAIMILKYEELLELIDILYNGDKVISGQETIKKTFISEYIKIKYYNIENNIKETSKNLTNKYNSKGKKYIDLINTYKTVFILINELETAKDSLTDINVKVGFYKKTVFKNFNEFNVKEIDIIVKKIIKIQRKYTSMINYLMKKTDSNTFALNLNKVNSKRNMYAVDLQHNLNFSKVYSDYIIDKTYTQGIVAEDKIYVLTNILLTQIARDMISSDFNKKYVFYIPNSLYNKEKKIDKFLNIMNDEYVKDNVIILITFGELVSNKLIVSKAKKLGFKFALVFDKNTMFDSKKRSNISISDYIFVNKKDSNIQKILSFIPEDLANNIIYDDVLDKIDGVGSE